MTDKESSKKITKTDEPAEVKKGDKEVKVKEPTPLASILPDDPAIVKALEKGNVVSVEQLKKLSDKAILAIPGIQTTRLGKIRVALGKPRWEVTE